jgi:hypothetical protein
MGERFVHPLDQERVKEPGGLIQQWRACGADRLDDGDLGTAEQIRWRDKREHADEDLRLMGNDPIPWHELWIETRWLTPAFKLDEAAAAGAVVDALLGRIAEGTE